MRAMKIALISDRVGVVLRAGARRLRGLRWRCLGIIGIPVFPNFSLKGKKGLHNSAPSRIKKRGCPARQTSGAFLAATKTTTSTFAFILCRAALVARRSLTLAPATFAALAVRGRRPRVAIPRRGTTEFHANHVQRKRVCVVLAGVAGGYSFYREFAQEEFSEVGTSTTWPNDFSLLCTRLTSEHFAMSARVSVSVLRHVCRSRG